MLGAGLFVVFVFGLPISFLIGAFIGYVVWVLRIKKRRPVKKKKYLIVGGVSYIVAQPISFLLVALLPIRKLDTLLGYSIPYEGFSLFEMVSVVLFAIVFTVAVTITLSAVDLRRKVAKSKDLKEFEKGFKYLTLIIATLFCGQIGRAHV